MKKLFTLVALLAVFMGAKADWVEDYSLDYSSKTSFPFYVMGYVPEWVNGVMTDYGADFRYATQETLDTKEVKDGGWADGESSVGTVMAGTTEYQKVTGAGPYWHQYFIADGIPTEIDGSYKVTAYVKASEACKVKVNMGWSWGEDPKSAEATIGTDWAEVVWEYSGIGGASCNLVAQPGTITATIEWKWVKVEHNAKPKKPTVWQEWLTSDGQPVVVQDKVKTANWMGDAETAWTDANVAFDDATKNYLICAWSKERMRNLGEPDADGKQGWNPFPADIEVDPKDPSNHVFVCHGKPATTEGDASAWDNQFWIQSPKAWAAGDVIKVHFRYMASADVSSTDTQIHKQNPSDYLIWHAIGNIAFTTEWKDFDGQMTIADDMVNGWSIAFNLNSVVKDAVTFYFDDLSWQTMVLDNGYFVAGANPTDGLDYDLDNAIEFVEGEDWDGAPCLVATVGEKGAYVSQIMISTVRGNDASYKTNTLGIAGTVTKESYQTWDFTYTPKSLAKINLPASGIWNVYLDPEYKAVGFDLVEGTEVVYEDVVTNASELVVKGVERDDFSDVVNGQAQQREEEGGTGEAWDNQFWIAANRDLAKGEVTKLVFKYKASSGTTESPVKTSTQCHNVNNGKPTNYLHWAAIGDVNFTTEWQNFSQEFTVPDAADGMRSITFNMAEIKAACDYYIKDVQWYVYDSSLEAGKTTENLINATGTENFWVKIGAGTAPYQYGTDPSGIENVNAKKAKTSTAIYNLAGQRVDNGFKGIVIKDGKKYVK